MQLHTDISTTKPLNASYTSWLDSGDVPVLKIIDIPASARVFVVGDLHGMRSLLIMSLLEQGFDFKKDVCVCTGDLINKGIDSLGTLQLLNEAWFFSVRGNHEELAIEALQQKCPWSLKEWSDRGGDWFFNLNAESKNEATDLILKKAAHLPLAIQINVRGKKYGVTHGDYSANDWSTHQLSKTKFLKTLTTERSLAIKVKQKKGKTLEPVSGIDAIYHGHTTVRFCSSAANRHWIDTNAHATGKLCALELCPIIN